MVNCIDVIIPVYNPPETFKRLIKILLKDEFVNKIILIIKGSLDLQKNEKIIKIKEPNNSCLAYVRKIGLNHSKSVFIAFIDSDVLLNKNHLRELLNKAIKLKEKYNNIAIEGTLTQIFQNKLIQPYSTKKLLLGDRGFTHNTLITRSSLIDWSPPFTCSWEDYSITQHLLKKSKSIWLRYEQKSKSYHIKDYGLLKRSIWSSAGKRIIVKPTNAKILLETLNYLKRAIIQPFLFNNINYFKYNLFLGLGNFIGHFNYQKYFYLQKNN